jgi:hypothetical protein
MDRGRVEAAVRAAGASVEFVATVPQLEQAVDEGARLAVVDLAVTDVLAAVAALSALGTPTVGFGSHVDRDLLRRARDGGCQEVVPRSAVSRRLPQIVAAGMAGVVGTGQPTGSDSAPDG